MVLDTIENPKVVSEVLVKEWHKVETQVRKARQNGDEGLNNGVKPEFIERFQLFIPYLPLPRKIIAKIARVKLEQFRAEMKEIGYIIQLPKVKSLEEWREYDVHYEDVDSVSGMIAEDIINREALSSVARTINRIIDNYVKTKVANEIAYREKNDLTMDGAVRIKTNGNASFEVIGIDRPDVSVVFVERGSMRRW